MHDTVKCLLFAWSIIYDHLNKGKTQGGAAKGPRRGIREWGRWPAGKPHGRVGEAALAPYRTALPMPC